MDVVAFARRFGAGVYRVPGGAAMVGFEPGAFVTMIGNHAAGVQHALEHAQGLQVQLVEAQQQVQHWRANHDAQVRRAQVLFQRPDLPFERIQAYNDFKLLQEEVERLRAQNAELLMKTAMAAMTAPAQPQEGPDHAAG